MLLKLMLEIIFGMKIEFFIVFVTRQIFRNFFLLTDFRLIKDSHLKMVIMQEEELQI